MARSVIVLTQANLTLTIDGGTPIEMDFACQVSTAAVTPTPNAVDVPATFCAAASQTAAKSSWALDLVVLQDWGATDSVCQFLFDHDAEQATFHIDGINVDGNNVNADGTCTVQPVQLGGEAGAALAGTASLPIIGTPVIAAGVAPAAASSEPDEVLYQPA